jgi:hypothetical protein
MPQNQIILKLGQLRQPKPNYFEVRAAWATKKLLIF